LGLIEDVDMGELKAFVMSMISAVHASPSPLSPFGGMTEIVRKGLEIFIKPSSYKNCTNKLFCSVSRLDRLLPTPVFTNELISTYASNDELINAILSSCYIPVYYEQQPAAGYFDGGFTDNNPIIEDFLSDTITVDPFGKSGAMISNRRTKQYPNFASYVPCGEHDAASLIEHGFDDARVFMSENRRGYSFQSPTRSGKKSNSLGIHNPIVSKNLFG
jgi:hypothetical protein